MRIRLALESYWSLLRGVRSPSEFCRELAPQGVEVISFCDENSVNGIHECYEAASEASMSFIPSVRLICEAPEETLLVFALNYQGFSRICRLLSDLNAQPNHPLPFATLCAELLRDSHGIAIAAFSRSSLQTLQSSDLKLYTAITPYNQALAVWSKEKGIPLLAVDNSIFLTHEDVSVHQVLRAIALSSTTDRLCETDTELSQRKLLNGKAWEETFSAFPEALRNAELLTQEAINTPENQNITKGLFRGHIFPHYLPQTKAVRNELRKRVYTGAERRYGDVSDSIVERIEYELNIIESKGFSSLFLVMDDIVRMADEGKGPRRCGRSCGRGSAAASIVSWCLYITNVDPLEMELYFERFLNPARQDPPDIDVDFAWDERDALITKVIERFGSQYCARVANHNRFRWQSAVRECAKAHGYSDAQISSMLGSRSRNIRSPNETASRGTFTQGLPEQLLELARRIVGLPRSIGTHCGGLVITPNPISTYAPVGLSAEGYPLLGWDKEGCEAAGLVKIDLLGNRSLAVIRDALSNLAQEGIDLNLEQLRTQDDLSVIKALASGNSMGVFYIESPAMRQLQIKSGVGDFAHIVIHSSMIRPAANRFIKEYLRRMKGGAAESLDPRLDEILKETHGILCYQEDVSKTAIALAGFSESEADSLRKIIAKKAGGERLEVWRQRFFSGCIERKVLAASIQKIWDMMLSFDGYSFCKPHSASYAMVSFQSAWLRVHHGAAFMAAVLSNQGGYYSAQAYVSEARRMGLSVSGPDINRSQKRWYGHGQELIAGFMTIAELSNTCINTLLVEREQHGPFINLEDLSHRVSLSKDDTAALVNSGSLDSLSPEQARPRQLLSLLLIREHKHSYTQNGAELFSTQSISSTATRGSIQLVNKKTKVKQSFESLNQEFQSLGFLRQAHPLIFYKKELSSWNCINACELLRYIGKRVLVAGWQITRKEILTKDGKTMTFVSFEDESALYEAVVFPDVYQRCEQLLYSSPCLVVQGISRLDEGALCLELEALYHPADQAPHFRGP